MPEIWKEVPSEPLLEASNFGRIRSKTYYGQMPYGGCRAYRMAPTYGFESKARKKSSHVRLQVTFRRKTYRVARLVCEAFHGLPRHDANTVIHMDENSFNNRSSNVKWGTQLENLNCAGFIEYRKSQRGDNSAVRKGNSVRYTAEEFSPI